MAFDGDGAATEGQDLRNRPPDGSRLLRRRGSFVRTDGRGYKLTFDDSLGTRDRRVSHQGEMRFAATSDWQTVTVVFADLEARVFGRAVQADPFRPDLGTELTGEQTPLFPNRSASGLASRIRGDTSLASCHVRFLPVVSVITKSISVKSKSTC